MRIMILFLAAALWLMASVGQIAGMRGDVKVDRAAKSLKAHIGMALQKGDRLTTAANASAQLIFHDDTVITLGKNSDFRVEDFDYAGAKPTAKFSAVKGALKVMTGQIAKTAPQNFELKSRTATIGIRGTHFLGVIEPDGDTFACTDGKIAVASLTQGGEVLVPAGQLTRVVLNQPPVPPRPYTGAELRKLSASAGGEESSNGNGQNGKGDTEEESGEGAVTDVGDLIKESAPEAKTLLSGDRWVFYSGWYYEDQTYLEEEWGGYAELTRFTPVSSYVEWGRASLSFTLSEEEKAYIEEALLYEEGIDPGSITLPSSLTVNEYYTYPAEGYAITSAMPEYGLRTYTGQIAGGVMEVSDRGIFDRGEIVTAGSQMSMTVDYSTGAITSGSMQFSTTQGDSWNATFEGYQSSSGSPYFSGVTISGVDYGYIDGVFVGPDAAAAMGDFGLMKGSETSAQMANGVFSLK